MSRETQKITYPIPCCLGMLLAGVVAATSMTEAMAANYIFTNFADNTGPFRVFGDKLSLNADGAVAFVGRLDDGGGGIYTTNGGPPTAIATTAGFISFNSTPTIN